MPYVALTGLKQPGTLYYGYQPGDPVDERVVREWGLVDGTDVQSYADGEPVPTPHPPALPRPGDDATRAQWQTWAVANGMDPDEAAETSIEDLQGFEPRAAGGQDRPAESDTKATWVKWAVAAGADKEWANDRSTTKADLMEWDVTAEQADEPPVGDTVAESLNDRANG